MTRLAVGVALLILAAIAAAIGLVLVRPRVCWTAGPEDEFIARAVWHELERDPDFNEDLRRGEADLAAGKGVPWEPECRRCTGRGHTTAWHEAHWSWQRPSVNSPSWTRDSSQGFGEAG